MSKPTTTLVATYHSYVSFRIPKDVVKYLLTQQQCDALGEQGFRAKTPGLWWVRWGKMHYFDMQGEEQELSGDESCDYKHADSTEFEEEDSDDEEEESEDEE
jgi:hypothetical protein